MSQPPTLGLIGRPLAHSFSPRYFARLFERLGLSHQERYEAFELARIEELPALLERYPSLRGLNVTLPYKREVLRYATECSPAVETLGAANVLCIERDEGHPPRLTAHNTDVIGFRESLRRWLGGERPRALVFGTGGAASAVCYALDELDIAYQQVSRRPSAGLIGYTDITSEVARTHRLWINATPVGLHSGQLLPLPYACLSGDHWCYDLIYNPSPTSFLERASQSGAHTHDGLAMLHGQAEAAWSLWSISSR